MRDDLRKAIENDPFKKEVMLYLRNLATKHARLVERINNIESLLMKGFQATGVAFNQTKIVCQAIADEARETKENLAEYGGVIESSTFDSYMRI